MKSIVDTLMERDGISRLEATDIKNELRNSMLEMLENGEEDEAYEIMSEVGLEPDYLEELIY